MAMSMEVKESVFYLISLLYTASYPQYLYSQPALFQNQPAILGARALKHT